MAPPQLKIGLGLKFLLEKEGSPLCGETPPSPSRNLRS